MSKSSGEHDASELRMTIERILPMSTEQLSHAWRSNTGKTAPQNLPRSLSARLLAYRLQADQYGDLRKEAVRSLDGIADDLGSGRAINVTPPAERRLRPGVVLVREHQGVQHRVMVLEDGYAWRGKTFRSLSSAAKAITGTNWNGNTFFGLREKKKAGSKGDSVGISP